MIQILMPALQDMKIQKNQKLHLLSPLQKIQLRHLRQSQHQDQHLLQHLVQHQHLLQHQDLWQQHAVSALRAGKDVVVHAPTGAGKTLVFELWSNQGRNRSQAIYTVPTRALANDKLAEWRARGWNVGIATGDLSDNLEAPVIVATLETQKNRLIHGDGPTLLVIDEYQMLGDADRGLNYELAIALISLGSLAPLKLPPTSLCCFLPPELNWSSQTPGPDPTSQREASPPQWFKQKLRLSPPRSRLQTVVRPLPSFHITTVISKRAAWYRRFKRHIGYSAKVILEGKLCIPCSHHEGPPLDAPNLKSCFATAAHQAFVDSIISEYLITSVVSWYPPSSKPLAVCPLGVVPKKTEPFFRLVIDARGPNARMSRWPSNMKSLASSAHIFEPGSVCWTLDLAKAYTLSPLMGCRPAFTPRVRADGFKFDHVGCEPDNCSLGCSKCLLGFRWRNNYFVFNAPMFGGKVSGNILDALLAPIDRWVRCKGIPMLRWVDDYCLCVPPRPEYRHDTSHCGGFGSCFMCDDTHKRALKLQNQFYALLEQLGFTFNDKRTELSQRGEFIGLGWDTLRCTFWMPVPKALKITDMAAAATMARSASRRELAQIRGRLVWFSPCLSGVRLLTRAINSFVGNPDSESEWDAVVALPDDVLAELLHWQTTLPSSACHEHPLWTLKPVQIHELYNLGRRVVSVCLETDASIYGWGCIVKYLVNDEWCEQRTSIAWEPGQPSIQVHCEAEALHQALLTFSSIVSNNAVLHITDCEPTLDLPERGSAASAQLQAIALNIWRLCSARNIFLSSAWVPGDEMISSGCDALSRSSLEDQHCATLRPTGWSTVLLLAQRVHRELSVDWFADNINHQLPLFWSRYPHHASIDYDSFNAPSWDHSSCHSCGIHHPIFGYFFPPVPLLDRVLAKAKIDGASGIIVVPRLVSSLWWPILLSAAIAPIVRLPADAVNSDRQHCSQSYQRYVWNAVAFDFSARPRSNSFSAPPLCKCRPIDRDIPVQSSPAQVFRKLHSKLAVSLLQP